MPMVIVFAFILLLSITTESYSVNAECGIG